MSTTTLIRGLRLEFLKRSPAGSAVAMGDS
jgi:hypothetical protein